MRRTAFFLAAALFACALDLFSPALDHGFLLFDDEGYITRNPAVLGGLTWDGIVWAVTNVGHGGNWHPLAWLSRMLDVQLFGLEPRWHHATSLFLHAANTVALFALLGSTTGAVRRSAIVAFLFAVHPLHVESVAWIAERKDVLCAFFSLLSLLVYCRHARRPGAARYLATLLLFAFALLAKPMAVTLPFLILLLDFWPLGRWRDGEPAAASRRPHAWARVVTVGRLSLEKAPFLILTVGAAYLTFLAQERSGSIEVPLEGLSQRFAHAAVSLVMYLGKTLWPAGLTAFYPYPVHGHPPWAVIGALLLLVALTGVAVRQVRRHPWLLTGWLWFLGMLVPVIGLVQAGAQAMADRYTYLPLCGLFAAAVWEGNPRLWPTRFRVPALPAAALLAIPLVLTTRSQIAVWRDDITLGWHALAVMPENWLLQNNLGLALARQGKFEDALVQLREVTRTRPTFDRGWNNLGMVLLGLGRPGEAAGALAAALRLNPRHADAHYNLGIALTARGDLPAAELHYRRATEIEPANSDALTNLGELLMRQARFREAADILEKSLRSNPDDGLAHTNLGLTLERLGRTDEAIAHHRRALAIRPESASARGHLDRALRQRGTR